MSAPTRLSELETLVRAVRRFLEPHWRDWHRKSGSPPGRPSPSAGTCGRSSRFLWLVLRDAGFQAELVFGSPVECDCGYLTARGWRGHAWVLCHDPARIIDVTADQFGAPDIVITDPDDPTYRAGHDVASDDIQMERHQVARALFEQWRDQRAGARAPV